MDLTKATDIFLKHYNLWTKNSKIKQIKDYNTHKIRHSIWVLEYGRLILLKMWENVSEELKQKSEICFLLHDIARFYQNDWKKVLSNKIFEHWDAGYNLAKKDWYSADICLAIKYHNKKDYLELFKEKEYKNFSLKEKKETEFLVKITRDADKLENMLYLIFNINHILLLGKKNERDIKKDFISKWALENILEKKIVERYNIKTKIDKILAMVSWIFDINFIETKKILKQNKFLKKIWKILEQNLDKENLENLEKILDICKKELKKLTPTLSFERRGSKKKFKEKLSTEGFNPLNKN